MPTGSGGRSAPLVNFFSDTPVTSKAPFTSPSSVTDDIYNMPDLVDAGNASESGHSDVVLPNSPVQRGMSGEIRLTLEEIGKRRHLEWLESRRGEGW